MRNRKTRPSSQRVVFTEGGVGKTAFTSLLVEWYGKQSTPHALLDLDTGNKGRGSFAHYFPKACKVNIHMSEGLDSFVDVLDVGTPIVIADRGAGAGAVAHRWFDPADFSYWDNDKAVKDFRRVLRFRGTYVSTDNSLHH
jgi:hypothetical protein